MTENPLQSRGPNARDGKVTRSQLNNSIRRYIKDKEKYLERTCRTMWTFTNPLGERFIFASFCRNRDSLIVTIGVYYPGVGWGSARLQ